MLFKELAGVDAFPLCLSTTDVDEIVRIVEGVAPTFGGINLEDIAAPRCFEIERRLKESLDIPVFHDDQHGTAVVVLAALLNALKVVGKARGGRPRGRSSARARPAWRARRSSSSTASRTSSSATSAASCTRAAPTWTGELASMAARTNPRGLTGTADDALDGADVVVGVSAPGAFTAEAVRTMAKDAIVFAMANPTPEVQPEEVWERRRDHGHGPQRLPEPDQQRARVPGHLPRRAGRPRPRDRRGDEARRRARDRRRDPGVRPRPRVHRPERLQPQRGAGGGRRRGGRGDRVGDRPPRPWRRGRRRSRAL